MIHKQDSRLVSKLADSLSLLEGREAMEDATAVREAILQIWERLEKDMVAGTADLSADYLADIHRQLATRAGGDEPGIFYNRASWGAFLVEATEEDYTEPAWVLAQLRWGEHVRSLSLSLGWLAMNIALMTSDSEVIVPPIDDHERLLKYLDYAGPDLYDAESLRALIGRYRVEQEQRQNVVPN